MEEVAGGRGKKMFDSLLNSKFYNKCKYAFKCIRTRMAPIRRKKHAMIRFLKKDVADLLANGLDTHAFGRMDGLMIELNHATCYDMIEEFCDYIGKQLGSLQKQRDCPSESREAVSTLIFAAARFPDLPELCDLRHIFTERYGNFVEPFVSLEFVRKLDTTEFTNEEKLQVMQSIAEELSVSFDAKELKLKLWTVQKTEHDMLEKISRNPAEPAMLLSNKKKCGEDAPYGKQNKTLEDGSIKPAELPMPLSNKQKGNEDAPCERKNKDMLDKGSRKQAERAIPSPNKQKRNEDAPYGRQDNDMLENSSIKPAELATPLSYKQRGNEDAPCERRHGAKPACRTEKVEMHTNPRDIQVVVDGIGLIDENTMKQQSDKSDEKEHLQKSVSPVDTNRRNTQKDVKKLNRRDGRPSEKELMEAVELDLNGLPKKGFGAVNAVKFPETESNITINLNARSKVAVKEQCVEKENEEAARHHSLRPGGPDLSRKHADPVLRAQRPVNQGCPVSPLNGNRNKGPHAKLNGAILKNPSEKEANNGLLYGKPQHFTDLGNGMPKGPGVTGRTTTMRPPYVKPKSSMQPVNDDSEKQTPSDCSKHNISGQIDHMVDKDVLRPVSVRRRTAKPPAPVNAYGDAPNQTPSSHTSHSSRQPGSKYDHDPNGNGIADERTPSRRPKHTGRKNGALNDDYDRFMQSRQPEADDSAIDFGNLLPRNANGQRRHKGRGHGDLDEEERMMDNLLMHYSKKGFDATNKADNEQKISLHTPGRAISLPPEPTGPGEEVKIPARSTSLQPDGPRVVRVHPKMPDFDELAARVNALRKA